MFARCVYNVGTIDDVYIRSSFLFLSPPHSLPPSPSPLLPPFPSINKTEAGIIWSKFDSSPDYHANRAPTSQRKHGIDDFLTSAVMKVWRVRLPHVACCLPALVTIIFYYTRQSQSYPFLLTLSWVYISTSQCFNYAEKPVVWRSRT